MTWAASQPNLRKECVANVGMPRRAARSRAFYRFVTACKASKLGLRSQINHGMMSVI